MLGKESSIVPAAPVPPPRSTTLVPKMRLHRRSSSSSQRSNHSSETENTDHKAIPLNESQLTTSSPTTVPSRNTSAMIFPLQPQSKQVQDEVTISLQQNVIALTASNQREKRIHELLKKQIESITEELCKFKELYEEEKLKNEKITAAMRKNTGSPSSGFAGEVNGDNPAVAAVMQQQAQMEITYQRKVLSLENRYKDLAENNRRLLKKIEQLEKTEADADATIAQMREENITLATQVDSLTSTVSSQSSLIIGLRTTVQKLQQVEQQAQIVRKKLDRAQLDLEASRIREKVLRDDLEQTKQTMHKEKESLMSKILEIQMRLQHADRVVDDVDALTEKLQRVEIEKRNLESQCLDLENTKVALVKMETRLQLQENLANRLRQDAESLQQEKKQLVATIDRQREELTSLKGYEKKSVGVELLERQLQGLMSRVVDLEGDNNSLEQANIKLQAELDNFKNTRVSQDETVQALQLARQKAATYEGLTLVNDEKMALEDKLKTLAKSWASQREELEAVIKQYATENELQTKRNKDLIAELASVKEQLHSDDKVDKKVVKKVDKKVDKKVEKVSQEDHVSREQIEADVARLQAEYADLQESVQHVNEEYNALLKKKYKTESFHAQARLLQNENTELRARMEEVLREMERNRAELEARAIEIVELQARVMDPRVIEMLRKTQESLEKTVSSLVETEIASESTFTCLQCMRLFVNPMTLTPCGHTYCTSCLDKLGDVSTPSSIVCKECAGKDDNTVVRPTETVFPNQSLADLTARFIFRQQTLSSLTTMCLSLRNSYATRSAVV